MTIREQYRLAWQWARYTQMDLYYRSEIAEHCQYVDSGDLLKIRPEILGMVIHQLIIRNQTESRDWQRSIPFWERQLFQGNPRHTHALSLMAWRCYGIEMLTVVACWEGYLKSRKDGAWVRHIV